MNDDRLKGKVENLKGRVKQAFGAATGNKNAEAEGAAERLKGAAREKVGEAKEAFSGREREPEDAPKRKTEEAELEEEDTTDESDD